MPGEFDDKQLQHTKKSFLNRWLGWRALVLLVFVFFLLSPVIYRGWKLRGVPDFPEPFDREPLLNYSVPASDNAFTDYRKAISLYTQPTDEVEELRDRIYEEGWHLANDEVRQFLHDNEAALQAWRTGTEKDLALFIPAKDYHLEIDLDPVQEMREFYRTVVLLCHQLEAEGKPDEAWEWYRASFRASRHVGAHGGIIERIIGAAFFAVSAHNLEGWSMDPRLNPDDLQESIEDLQSACELTEQASTTLQIEYLSFHQTLDNFMQGLSPNEEWIPVPPALMYFTGEPELSQRLSRICFHNQLMFCDEDRNKRPEKRPRYTAYDDPRGFNLGEYHWDAQEFESALDRSILAKLLLPATSQFLNATDREAIRYRCLLVALASQSYFRDHGEFPADANELVPEYLDEIPDDLYSPTPAPLQYRRNGDDAVVYSRFENEIDDGGTEVSYDDLRIGQDLLDFGFRIRNPFGKPLRAPKTKSN